MNKSNPLVLALTLAPLLFLSTASANEVMGWVPAYGIAGSKATLNGTYGKYKAKDGLTHIGLQFWQPTNSGGVTFAGAGAGDVQWFTDWGKTNNVKVLLTVFNATNGWDWNLATTAFGSNRTGFANALVAEMDKYNLDGVDLDLEGNKLPANDHRTEFKAFVNELSTLLKAKGKLLSICTFNNENSDNMPDESWFPDWVGKIDYIHVMGYEEMYENSPDKTQAYSYQQNLGAKAGYARNQVSMGLMGSDSWGGGSALQHVNECITKPKETASVCIWDLQLPGGTWKTEAVWDALAKIKGTTPVTGLGGRSQAEMPGDGNPRIRVVDGKIEFLPGVPFGNNSAGNPVPADAMGRVFELPMPMRK